MTYRGRVENGVVVLESGTALPEGATVRLEVVEEARNTGRTAVPLSERLKHVIGKAEGLPADYSAQHDHYLYGVPKTP